MSLWMNSSSVALQIQAIYQYIPIMLFVFQFVLQNGIENIVSLFLFQTKLTRLVLAVH